MAMAMVAGRRNWLAHGDSQCPMNALHFHTSSGGQRERLTRLFNPPAKIVIIQLAEEEDCDAARTGSMDHHRDGDHAVKLMPSAYQWPDTSAPKVPRSRHTVVSIERDESRWQTRYPPPSMRLFLIEKSGKDEGMRVCASGCACPRTRVCDVYRGVEEKIGSVTDTWCDDDDEKEADPSDEEDEEEVRREEERVHLLNLSLRFLG
ncbi:Uncharacterized protein DBV15_11367 [Temnothorax longispinosus]|uniref:Uncharacterized protein n=1 Tax=Temnothorax longispinosus TaxID=300112 RepID=A0A4S2KMF0_9HYME|nr:Uncharacterized protein DBV15_11367 [Temnothorax longispinosus]